MNMDKNRVSRYEVSLRNMNQMRDILKKVGLDEHFLR